MKNNEDRVQVALISNSGDRLYSPGNSVRPLPPRETCVVWDSCRNEDSIGQSTARDIARMSDYKVEEALHALDEDR